jgi:uncharacterized protein
VTVRVGLGEQAPMYRAFEFEGQTRLLVVPYSRIFTVEPSLVEALAAGEAWARQMVEDLSQPTGSEQSLDSVPLPTPQSISLNVSQKCNLGCNYCYAGQGEFAGAQTTAMSWEVARAAVDRLYTLADPSVPVTIGFIGGEPFLNRGLIHCVVEYAAKCGRERGQPVGFSVTTNGTTLLADDVAMLRTNRFAVTVSIDGGRALQDVQRPMKSGGSSFAALGKSVGPLLESPGLARVAARATVTRSNLQIGPRFDDLMRMGFPEAGFSPVRSGPSGDSLNGDDWREYLAQMIELASRGLGAAFSGAPLRFTNLAIALKQLRRGFSMPYPCGAGGGYFSVSSDGAWYACHRAIGMDDYVMGGNEGLDDPRRLDFLRARHVHSQPECGRCWARYLCSGGCHHEASSRSDSSCGFIRGWLEYCLGAYCAMAEKRPDWFDKSA